MTHIKRKIFYIGVIGMSNYLTLFIYEVHWWWWWYFYIL